MRFGARILAWATLAVGLSGTLAYVVSCANDNNVDVTCPTYCADIMNTCSGVDSMYPTTDQNATCLRMCGAMTPGTPGSAGSDSVACRRINISQAKDETDPALKHTDCVNGGPSTGGCNKSQCETFCAQDTALCVGANSPYEGGVPDCLAACATWGTSFDGVLIGSTGNTLQCRTYHLELSQTGNPADLVTHCLHTGLVSARCNNGTSDAGPDSATDATSD